MPEPAGLVAASGVFGASRVFMAAGTTAALLVPVVLLLFAAIRLRRRLRYPHDLVQPSDERRPAAVLLRSLRLYYDAAIDAAGALLVGLALAGLLGPGPWRGPATVLDASSSMLAGLRGDRPLDEAARIIMGNDDLASRPLFILGWAPETRQPRLRNATSLLRKADSPQELVAGLEASEAFMSADFSLVRGLAGRGYGPLTIVSDDPSLVTSGPGIELRPLAARPPRYILKAQAAWNEETGRSRVRFVASGGAALESVWKLSDDGSLARARPEDYGVRELISGFELAFKEGGLWALRWDGHLTPFRAPERPKPLRADGPFSRRLVEALGSLGAPDAPAGKRAGKQGGALLVRDGAGSGVSGRISVARAESEAWLVPPGLTFGAVVAAGADKNADLALGRAALASPETALAFWVARWAFDRDQESPAGRRLRPIRVGDGYLYPAAAGSARIVAPPAGEYAPAARRTPLRAGNPPEGRLPVALALAALYGLKLLLARRFGDGRRAGIKKP